MNKQLEELRKWSESITRSAWDGFFQAFKGKGISPPSSTGGPGSDMLFRLIQLNRMTLSMIEQFRYWEKLNEQLKGVSESLLGGLNFEQDSRIQELESEIEELKTRLNSQEEMLKQLQSKLNAEEALSDEPDRTTRILSSFFSEQTRQFQKLVKPE